LIGLNIMWLTLPSLLPLHRSLPSRTQVRRIRIGYLVPEFPGQTHIFFWRELAALKKMGIDADVVSTRPPNRALMPHSWTQTAIQRTTYLTKPGLPEVAGGASVLLRAGLKSWRRCLKVIRDDRTLSWRGRARLAGLVPFGAELACLAKERGWKHIHVHSCGDAANIAMFSRLLGGPSYSVTLHGPLHDYGPNQRVKWGQAEFGLLITQRLFKEVRETLNGFAPAKLGIAPMGVDVRAARRRTPYQPWRGGPVRIFTCGRLNPIKGHDDLIRAIKILADRGWDVHLKIAGQDDAGGTGYRLVLEQLRTELAMEKRVTLMGPVGESIVLGQLENAHVFCLASINEALGVAIMEAMAMETPVVATNAGGVPELVDDGINGRLVEPRHPEQLADAIEQLLKAPALARRLGAAGRQKILRQFRSDESARVLARMLGVGKRQKQKRAVVTAAVAS
jgi:colanic acid/amylovoran biosynthesis glycosyltransferase